MSRGVCHDAGSQAEIVAVDLVGHIGKRLGSVCGNRRGCAATAVIVKLPAGNAVEPFAKRPKSTSRSGKTVDDHDVIVLECCRRLRTR